MPATVEALAASGEYPRQQGGEVCPSSWKEFVAEWVNGKPVFDLPRVFAHVLPEEGRRMPGSTMKSQVMKLLKLTSPFVFDYLRKKALSAGIIVQSMDSHRHVFYHRPVSSASADGRKEMVQGKLFADDASGSIPTLDLMGDGPVDDLPF